MVVQANSFQALGPLEHGIRQPIFQPDPLASQYQRKNRFRKTQTQKFDFDSVGAQSLPPWISDISPPKITTEDDSRKRLVTYTSHTLRKCPPVNPDINPRGTWAKVQVIQDSFTQEDIVIQLQKLAKNRRSVIDKCKGLAPNQQGQVTSLLDDLRCKERDLDFEWSLVQIDSVLKQVPRENIRTINQVETVTLTVYAKRSLRREITATSKLRALEEAKKTAGIAAKESQRLRLRHSSSKTQQRLYNRPSWQRKRRAGVEDSPFDDYGLSDYSADSEEERRPRDFDLIHSNERSKPTVFAALSVDEHNRLESPTHIDEHTVSATKGISDLGKLHSNAPLPISELQIEVSQPWSKSGIREALRPGSHKSNATIKNEYLCHCGKRLAGLYNLQQHAIEVHGDHPTPENSHPTVSREGTKVSREPAESQHANSQRLEDKPKGHSRIERCPSPLPNTSVDHRSYVHFIRENFPASLWVCPDNSCQYHKKGWLSEKELKRHRKLKHSVRISTQINPVACSYCKMPIPEFTQGLTGAGSLCASCEARSDNSGELEINHIQEGDGEAHAFISQAVVTRESRSNETMDSIQEVHSLEESGDDLTPMPADIASKSLWIFNQSDMPLSKQLDQIQFTPAEEVEQCPEESCLNFHGRGALATEVSASSKIESLDGKSPPRLSPDSALPEIGWVSEHPKSENTLSLEVVIDQVSPYQSAPISRESGRHDEAPLPKAMDANLTQPHQDITFDGERLPHTTSSSAEPQKHRTSAGDHKVDVSRSLSIAYRQIKENGRKMLRISFRENDEDLACADSGSEKNIMSKAFAEEKGFRIRGGRTDRRRFQMGNGEYVESIGRVHILFSIFGLQNTRRKRWFHILATCPEPLILGMSFLAEHEILTANKHLLVDYVANLAKNGLLSWIGTPRRRMGCSLDGRFLVATADTGSDLNLMSQACAYREGFHVDTRREGRVSLQVADGTIIKTRGIVYVANISLDWRMEDTSPNIDGFEVVPPDIDQPEPNSELEQMGQDTGEIFHVVAGLPSDIVLGGRFLDKTDAFNTCADLFYDHSTATKGYHELNILSFQGAIAHKFSKMTSRPPDQHTLKTHRDAHDDDYHAESYRRSKEKQRIKSLEGRARDAAQRIEEVHIQKFDERHKRCFYCSREVGAEEDHSAQGSAESTR